MNKTVAGLAILLASINVSHADVVNGKKLVKEKCSSCHLTEVYTRKDHKVKSYSSLKGQVSRCAHNLNSDLFPEDEQDIVNYLNESFYHFKK